MTYENFDTTDVINALGKLGEKMGEQQTQIAILWDIENVLPSADSLFIEGLLDYANNLGRVSVARCFADWSKRNVAKLAPHLSYNNFELIHIPKSRKNSADMVLITHGLELAIKYPHIGLFIILTGDADFRPLITSFKRNGKYIYIICDRKTASEELLTLADNFTDYRSLLPASDSFEKEVSSSMKQRYRKQQEPRKQDLELAYDLLEEAIEKMESEGKKPGIGIIKVKIKLMNPDFDEKNYGFDSWTEFVDSAIKERNISVRGKGAERILSIEQKTTKRKGLTHLFEKLTETLDEMDQGTRKQYHRYADVGNKLYEKISVQELKNNGFKQFKSFIQSAEARSLVETKVEDYINFVKRA